MRQQLCKCAVIVSVLVGMAMSADAQRRGRTRNQTQPSTNEPATTQPQQQNNNTAPVNYNPYANIPIERAPVTGGFQDTIKKSLRMDGATEKHLFKDRTPLAYEHLRSDDALFIERVWREIDIREKMNMPFRFQAEDDNGDQRFVSIIYNAVKFGGVTAFSADDDRFTTPLDSTQFAMALGGGGTCDTLPVYNLLDPTKIDKYVINCATLNPDDIVKFRIKEEWVFDREASRMFVRIIGIAPCKTVMSVDKTTERGVTPLFWVYYPDLRPTLAKYEVYNPKNMGISRMTWEELFEARMFSSYIIKSTLDNPLNKYIRSYVKDPILALLEGENVKEKIFNFEQNLWSY